METLLNNYGSTDKKQEKLRLLGKISEQMRRTPGIQTFGMSTTEQIRRIMDMDPSDREIFVTLCPIYGDNGIDTSRYDTFTDVPQRFQKKADMALRGAELLSSLFPTDRITLLLADQGIMIDRAGNYDVNNISSDLDRARQIYQARATSILDRPVGCTTFSEIGVPLDTIAIPDRTKTREDIEKILSQFGIDTQKFRFSLDVIIRGFGLANAYNLVYAYLVENQFLIQNYPNRMFLNTEFCGPLNSLYVASDNLKQRLNQSSLFTRLDLR